MAYEQKPNSCALFKNKFKKEGGKQPDYKGEVQVESDGHYMDFEVAMWVREDKYGNPYFSLRFSEPRERNENATKTQDGEIPF